MKTYLQILVCTFFVIPLLGGTQSYETIIDSLKNVLAYTNESNTQIDLLNEISYNYRRITPDSVLYYAQLAIHKSQKIGYKKGEALGYKNLGVAHYKLTPEIDTALHYYLQAIDLAEEINELYTLTASHLNAGICYYKKQNKDKAKLFLSKAVEYSQNEFEDNEYLRSLSFGMLGYTYFHQEDYEKAREYFERLDVLSTKNKDNKTLSIWLDNLAATYSKLGRYDKAEAAIRKCQAAQKELGDIESMIQTGLAIIDLKMDIKDYEAAIQEAYNTVALIKTEEFENYKIYAYVRASKAALENDQVPIALQTANEAFDLIEQGKTVGRMGDMYAHLQKVYTLAGESERGLLMADKRINYFIDIRDEEQGKLVAQMETKYEMERAEQENQLLKSQNQSYLLGLISLVLIALLSGLSLLISNSSKRKLRTKNEELHQTNMQLEKTKLEVIQAYQVKQNFLATMSHEIRTPISAVLGFTDILLEESPRIDQQMYLSNLKQVGQHLQRIINDILDFSKLESNKISFEKIPINLNKLLEDLIDTFEAYKGNKSIELQLQQSQILQYQILGDPIRLNQILYNLLSNAVKFTNKGVIRITTTILEQTDKNVRIVFAVEDTGIGISSEGQKRIFEKFQQADNSIARKFGGTGLGLAITKQLLQLQHSELQLTSELGKGSRFSFELSFPIHQSELSTASSPTANNYDQLSGKHILLAEDNKFNQVIVSKLLNNWGIEHDIVDNGLAAIDTIKDKNFDCILMDINMPEMDGLEATKYIRSLNNDKRNIPIIALSANTLEGSIQAAKQAGMNNYITKPFERDKMYEVIRSIL